MLTIMAERLSQQPKEKHYKRRWQWTNNLNHADTTSCLYSNDLDKVASQKRSSTNPEHNGLRTKQDKNTQGCHGVTSVCGGRHLLRRDPKQELTPPNCCFGCEGRCGWYWCHAPVRTHSASLPLLGVLNRGRERQHRSVAMANCTNGDMKTTHYTIPLRRITSVLTILNWHTHMYTHTHTHLHARTHARTQACTRIWV